MNLKLLMAQLNLLVGDVEGNARRVIETVESAPSDTDLVVFPELTLTGYPPEDLLLRDDFIARVNKALDEIQAKVQDVHIVLGYPRQHGRDLYNAAGLIGDGRILHEYLKQQLPNYSVFDEKRYFTPGHEPVVVELNSIQVGLTVCEDIWLPEPAAKAREAGAELMININASPFHLGKANEREALVRQRAIENKMPMVYVNLVGGQDELVFDGGSFVMDAEGQVTCRASFYSESMLSCAIVSGTPPVPETGPITPLPNETEAVYQALVLGVRDYVKKNGFDGAVVGLSGGVDSALTLAIAADALGQDRVEAVLMPSRYTSDMSNEDAAEQARALGVQHHSVPIEPAFNAFNDMLAPVFDGAPVDVTEENIQARCRGIILMAISNKQGRILLTTGNKSEMSVGYATLYGDMAGGFAPIKDVPKMMVYRLCEYRNSISQVIPKRVLQRPPSAELAPDQKDSDSLPEYPMLDAILADYVERDMSAQEIIASGYDEAVVKKVLRMVDRNEYKRRQAPPGVKITRRAYGRDRRYPLTRG